MPEQPQYFAHIFWTFTYKYYFNSGEFPNKPHVVACVEVSPRSWSRNEKQNDKLLQHEYGHYLIGCLCALEFMDKVNKKDAAFFTDKKKAIKFCQNSYVSTLKQFLKIEKKYDEET